MIARRLIGVAAALLLSVQAVRDAGVAEFAAGRPGVAFGIWAGHPTVEISLGLLNIGRASREREPIDVHTIAMIDDAASKSPLSPEPFLVRGVQAQVAGNAEAAKRAFLAAQWRDPRSLPAAYFLADYYLRAGDAFAGLKQTALLARLSPGGARGVAPFVAAYASDRSNWPAIRALFRSQNDIEGPVLAELAKDPRNTGAILALADAKHRGPHSSWLSPLLSSLLVNGNYAYARKVWISVGGGSQQAEQLIYDPGFSLEGAPPPFNWKLVSSSVGLTERQSGKGLHVIFYGNEDGVLASELLLLPIGAYWLQMQMAGAPMRPELLRWSIRCDKSQAPIASIGIDQLAKGKWNVQVPDNCPAQWLELSGSSGDIAQQSEATFSSLRLLRARTNG